jgi:hypothetical protein
MVAARYKGSPTRRSIQILNRLLDEGADLEAKNKQVRSFCSLDLDLSEIKFSSEPI